ncbi:LANO_0C04368g1_1 [Lachancea nothofagi CBS 11611]|uniref:Small ribosomal subunit protein uS9m n=1 Tax=Lachancea nothofagi CBS 11611 TaxID=1266666 RepID=A0A1G4J6L2_9SACH|nr:LANO_0C04368g1_1 [Lachancea nothofagi CBS 11611]
MFTRLCNTARIAVTGGGFQCRNFSSSFCLSKDYTLQQTRIVPKLTTFYSANPHHEDRIDRLEALLRKYVKLPTMQVAPKERPAWLSFTEYGLIGGGTRLKPIQYQQLVHLLNRLHSIEPELTNDEVTIELSQYFKKTKLQSSQGSVKTLDEFGRSVAVGRRKTSTAKVYLVRGSGEILVNGRQFNDYFVKMKDRESVAYPLKVVDSIGKYNAFVTTSGGGITGQAEATMHAIAKGLLIFNPLLKPRLHKAGVLTRDYRQVERKKPGKKKARKMPTWVKR